MHVMLIGLMCGVAESLRADMGFTRHRENRWAAACGWNSLPWSWCSSIAATASDLPVQYKIGVARFTCSVCARVDEVKGWRNGVAADGSD